MTISQNKVRNLTLNTEKTDSVKKEKQTEKSKFHVKVYYNFIHTSINKDYYSPELNKLSHHDENNNNFGRVSVGFVIENEKFMHEFELSKINFDREDMNTILYDLNDSTQQLKGGQIVKSFNLNLKYEYNRKVLTFKDKLAIYIGVSAEPYITFTKIEPKISTSFDTKNLSLGAKFYMMPRAIYNLSNRIYFDLNVPIEIIDTYLYWNRIDNPTLPKNLQRISGGNANWFNKIFQFRLGVGLRI